MKVLLIRLLLQVENNEYFYIMPPPFLLINIGFGY